MNEEMIIAGKLGYNDGGWTISFQNVPGKILDVEKSFPALNFLFIFFFWSAAI